MKILSLNKAVEAAKSVQGCLTHLKTTKGRRRFNEDEDKTFDAILSPDPFMEDLKRIRFSKAFRRMAGKTQVTAFPYSPYMRNRMTHTVEVAGCSEYVGSILGLHIPLIQSISYGHDMGHVPFGHQGESYLARYSKTDFNHETMGVFVSQHIERKTEGLNLTMETLEGMYRHSGSRAIPSMTQEAWTVRYGDKIAYLFADFNDFERLGWYIPSSLEKLAKDFGSCHRERVNRTICELCIESAEKGKVSFEDSPFAKKFIEFRNEMYAVYVKITQQNMNAVFDPVMLFLENLQLADPVLMISLMTDDDVARLSSEKMINFSHIQNTAVGEILQFIIDSKKDLTSYAKLDLDW